MENASKALIIAGAILISIVIISLGIVVVNNVSDTAKNASINSEEAQAFNSKFTFGSHMTATQVNATIQTVAAVNGGNYGDPDYKPIKVNAKNMETDAYVGTPSNSDDYVTCTFVGKNNYFNVYVSAYNEENGYVSEITVELEKTTTTPPPEGNV